MERKRWIDELRGFAIILVVVGHVIGGLDQSVGGGVSNPIRQAIYFFHMPLLFMISGMVSRKIPKETFHIFLTKTLLSLYVPYLLFGYIFWATKYFIYMGNEIVTISDALRLPFDFSAWVPGWYLLALIGIKIAEYIWDVIFHIREIGKYIIWVILFGIGAANLIIIPTINVIFMNGLYYEIGRTLTRKDYKTKIPTSVLILIVLGLFVCNYSRIQSSTFDNSLFYVGINACIGITISLVLIQLFRNKDSGDISWVLENLGKYSLIPYVLHAYFTIPVRIIIYKLGLDSFWICIIWEVCICIFLSLIMVGIIKRSKYLVCIFYPARYLKK